MNVLIAKAGKVGKAITAELLADGNDITIIDKIPNILGKIIEKFDVQTCLGNAASSLTLKEAS